jgi:catechol 2,3-dioxygenase-like lactoylglutathione lyase family enzyme
MRMSHVHCRVRDLQAATRWFERVWQIAPVFNNERRAWLPFGDLGVILDAAEGLRCRLSFDHKPRRGTDRGAAGQTVGRTRRLPKRTGWTYGRNRAAIESHLDVRRGSTSYSRADHAHLGSSPPGAINAPLIDVDSEDRLWVRRKLEGPFGLCRLRADDWQTASNAPGLADCSR